MNFGWTDVWLYINDKEKKYHDFELKVVTPKFVADSIYFAIDLGWKGGKKDYTYKVLIQFLVNN